MILKYEVLTEKYSFLLDTCPSTFPSTRDWYHFRKIINGKSGLTLARAQEHFKGSNHHPWNNLTTFSIYKSLSVNITYDKRYKDGTPLTVISYVMVVWITTVKAVSFLLNNIDTSKIIPYAPNTKWDRLVYLLFWLLWLKTKLGSLWS